ncbi:MAG: MFS transporter [Micropruina sp.]|uniref:MFS transporter n=1 Tax=Micropruina sp. TaxID=2737536 RepID=UPI0039E5DE8E
MALNSDGGASWRRLAVVIYLPTAVSFIGFGAIAPLVPLTARALGASVAEAALVVALMGIGTLIGALPAGVIADRFGEKKSLVGAMVVDIGCLLVCAFAPNTWVLAGAVFVTGLSGAMLSLARQSYLTVAVGLEYRARALSTLGGVFRIGSLLGPLMGAAVVTVWGLQAAYLVAAGTSLLAATVTMALPELPTPEHPPDEPVRLAQVLRRHAHTYATAGVGAAALMLVRTSRDALLPLWCEQVGLDAAATSLIFALSSGIDMTLFYLGGSVMDRFGRRWVSVPSMVIMSLCFALLPLAHSVVAVALFAAALGLGNGISAGVVMTIGSDASPAVGRPQFLAGWRLTTGIGQAAGPLLITAIAALAPLGAAALAIGAIGLTGAGWLWLWVREPSIQGR